MIHLDKKLANPFTMLIVLVLMLLLTSGFNKSYAGPKDPLRKTAIAYDKVAQNQTTTARNLQAQLDKIPKIDTLPKGEQTAAQTKKSKLLSQIHTAQDRASRARSHAQMFRAAKSAGATGWKSAAGGKLKFVGKGVVRCASAPVIIALLLNSSCKVVNKEKVINIPFIVNIPVSSLPK